MDVTVLAASGLTGVIALATQFLGQRGMLATRREERDFEVRLSARRESADLFAMVRALARGLDRPYQDLAALSEDQVDLLRAEVNGVVHGLDRLTVLLLNKNTSEWAVAVTDLFLELLEWFPSHPGCDDVERSDGFEVRRHLIHSAFDWNDGSRSSQVIRFRDAVIAAGETPLRRRHRWSVRRRRRLVARWATWLCLGCDRQSRLVIAHPWHVRRRSNLSAALHAQE
jgi:hypothetical protein